MKAASSQGCTWQWDGFPSHGHTTCLLPVSKQRLLLLRVQINRLKPNIRPMLNFRQQINPYVVKNNNKSRPLQPHFGLVHA